MSCRFAPPDLSSESPRSSCRKSESPQSLQKILGRSTLEEASSEKSASENLPSPNQISYPSPPSRHHGRRGPDFETKNTGRETRCARDPAPHRQYHSGCGHSGATRKVSPPLCQRKSDASQRRNRGSLGNRNPTPLGFQREKPRGPDRTRQSRGEKPDTVAAIPRVRCSDR